MRGIWRGRVGEWGRRGEGGLEGRGIIACSNGRNERLKERMV